MKQQGEENPESGSHVWGFGAGGPIVRNKAFWFFNLERDVIENAVSLVFPPEAAPLAESFSDAAEIKVWNTFLRTDYQAGGNNTFSFRWVREAATNIGEEWEDALALPESVEVENDEGDQVFNFNWTKVIGTRATNELKVSHVREILHSGNTEDFDDDFNYIELNGRDQFDVGSANEHPDFLAGPGAIHGSAEIRTYIVDDAFTFFKSGWHGTHTFKVGAVYSRNTSAPTIVGGNDNGTFEFLSN